MRYVALLPMAVLALPFPAKAQESERPLSFVVKYTKAGVTVTSASSTGGRRNPTGEGEIRVQCREIKFACDPAGKPAIEFLGSVKARGRWKSEFEARAKRMTISGDGKQLEFRGDDEEPAQLWKDAAGAAGDVLSARRVTWLFDGKVHAQDTVFFRDHKDDGKH